VLDAVEGSPLHSGPAGAGPADLDGVVCAQRANVALTLTGDDGRRLAADVSTVAVEKLSTRGLMIDAHALAVSTDLTVYDPMYLALAVRLEAEMVTADDRLGRTVAAHPMTAMHVRMLQTSNEPNRGPLN